MPINHWFLEHTFKNGFATHNAILDVTPYNPEVLFLGTYNPRTEINVSDFFYHRNYFWPTMFNLFSPQEVTRTVKRKHTNPTSPTLDEIQALCAKINVTFADLIKSTLHRDAVYSLSGNKVIYDNKNYNLINDDDLGRLNTLGQVDWATEDIIQYLLENPSINCVRFTRQPDKRVWREQWNQIINANYGRSINFGTIHTPSGMGLQEKGISIAKALTRRWLYHPISHKRLCDDWVRSHEVPVQKFKYDNPPLPIL